MQAQSTLRPSWRTMGTCASITIRLVKHVTSAAMTACSFCFDGATPLYAQYTFNSTYESEEWLASPERRFIVGDLTTDDDYYNFRPAVSRFDVIAWSTATPSEEMFAIPAYCTC